MEIIKEQPMFSIVTVTYNCCNSIRETIESVLNQTYSNLEIILVNDGSKDNSGLLCDGYAEKDGCRRA